MALSHIGNQDGTRIYSPTGETLRSSKNLRGMRDYARVSPVESVQTAKDAANQVRGVLRVNYKNGNFSTASFASYHIMIDFVRNCRSWRSAPHHMESENMGYLTKPGIIAGGTN